jgi:hypothetical protein
MAYYFADDIELYRMADAGPDVTDLRLKEVGAFEEQTFFWKPQFKFKINFH